MKYGVIFITFKLRMQDKKNIVCFSVKYSQGNYF